MLTDAQHAAFEDVFCGPWCNDRRGAHNQIEAQVLPVVERLLADARTEARTEALKWAADQVHLEARWQAELDMRGVERTDVTYRLGTIEQIIREELKRAKEADSG